MIRPTNAVVLALILSWASQGWSASGQSADTTQKVAPKSAESDKASAYYNFAMGHLYSELAGAYGNRGDYLDKAISHYKEALKADPSASFLFEELTDLYIQAGRLRDAVSEAEGMLRQDPKNLDARRILGRIYTRMIGDSQQGKINEDMVRRATEQYQAITAQDPKDLESWLTLARLYRVSSNSVDAEKAYKQVLAVDGDNEEALTGLAIVYSDVGDTKKAIETLKALTDKHPSSRTLAALASSYEQMRDYKSAAEILKRALELSPDNAHLKQALAQNLLYSEHYDEALNLYTQLAAADPKDAQAPLRLAEIYRQKSDFTKAGEWLAKAKALDADSLEVRYEEVNFLDAQGKPDQAITTLKSILDEMAKTNYSATEKSNRVMLLDRLGGLYRSAGQYQSAVDTFQQIATLDPDTGARVAVQVVDTWRAAKEFSKAQTEADAALAKYPNERIVKLMHASLLADLGKTDQAVAELRALPKSENDRETQLAIAQIYDRGKRYDDMAKALDAAERLSASREDKETIYFMRGAMLERLKKYDDAEAQFRKVLESNPDNASALNYLGYMFADRNVRLDEAQKLIGRALELDPQNGAYLDSMAWVYYHQNRLPEAENLLLNALSKIGKDPTVRDHLGDVYFKQGKTKDAITQWQAALKEWENSSQADLDPAEVAAVTKKLESARVRLAKETSGNK